MSACVCGADEQCPVICDEHHVVGHGYPCEQCQDEWRQANPNTADAIAKIASGKRASLNLADPRRADAALKEPRP